ncbi:MFS transporter [Candidatus Thorarchaeota archaeon]|nr:MAG: MFS transporter [Candidatus Thorarchaeota archaeon]
MTPSLRLRYDKGCELLLEYGDQGALGLEVTGRSKILSLSILTALNRLSGSFRVIVLPLFALAIGQDEAFYGLIVAMAGYMQSASALPAGILSDRKGRGIAILIGGIFMGYIYFLLPFSGDSFTVIILYALTGIGAGFNMTSVKALVADYTKKGDERTRSFGYTMAFATAAAIAGPFLGGFILDPIALPGISSEMTRYAIVFFIMGSLRVCAGIFGLGTEIWLKRNIPLETIEEDPLDELPTQDARNDAVTAGLFGISRLIMGFSSGLMIPYVILWIYSAFVVDPVVLGSLPAVSNLSLASGALFVGLRSERVGKIKMVTVLYVLAFLFTFGLLWSPFFLFMAVFYVARTAMANMAQPAVDSLFMGEVSRRRRGKSFALTRIMWTFPRQTGTLLTAFLLSVGFLGGMYNFGLVVFPIAMALYPVSVLPMYFAVKRNERLNGQSLEQASPLRTTA